VDKIFDISAPPVFIPRTKLFGSAILDLAARIQMFPEVLFCVRRRRRRVLFCSCVAPPKMYVCSYSTMETKISLEEIYFIAIYRT